MQDLINGVGNIKIGGVREQVIEFIKTLPDHLDDTGTHEYISKKDRADMLLDQLNDFANKYEKAESKAEFKYFEVDLKTMQRYWTKERQFLKPVDRNAWQEWLSDTTIRARKATAEDKIRTREDMPNDERAEMLLDQLQNFSEAYKEAESKADFEFFEEDLKILQKYWIRERHFLKSKERRDWQKWLSDTTLKSREAAIENVDDAKWMIYFTPEQQAKAKNVGFAPPQEKSDGTQRFDTDVAGMSTIRTIVKNKFVDPFVTPKLLPGSTKTLAMYGPAGTGKSYAVVPIFNMLKDKVGNIFLFMTSAGDLKGSKYGEAEARIKLTYEWLEEFATRKNDPNARCVLFIDEAEDLLKQRGGKGDEGGTATSIINSFLPELSGPTEKKRVITILATNYYWKLDEAVQSRFPTNVLVDLPSRLTILQLLYEGIHDAAKDKEKNWKKGDREYKSSWHEISSGIAQVDINTEILAADGSLTILNRNLNAWIVKLANICSFSSEGKSALNEYLRSRRAGDKVAKIDQLYQDGGHVVRPEAIAPYGVSIRDVKELVDNIVSAMGRLQLSHPKQYNTITCTIDPEKTCMQTCEELKQTGDEELKSISCENACKPCGNITSDQLRNMKIEWKYIAKFDLTKHVFKPVLASFTSSVIPERYRDIVYYSLTRENPDKV